MSRSDQSVVISGIKPTGQVHLGNYLGMIRPTLRLAERHEAYVFVADGHAMTTVVDPGELARCSQELAATLLALGLDPRRTALYRQSDVPEVFELAWTLGCSTPKGLLNRAHAYKASVAANRAARRPADEAVSAGLFSYPVLMAADILAVGATAVPVGADQAQHLEVTRDIAEAFNRSYGQVLTLPDGLVDEDVAVISGTDGRKMSKSYGNIIPILATRDELVRLVKGIVTDSRRPEEPKDPTSCAVYGLYRHLVDREEAATLAGRYRAGGLGYGDAKALLVDALERRFAPVRLRYQALMDDPKGLDGVLAQGAERARARAREVLGRVRVARGLAA